MRSVIFFLVSITFIGCQNRKKIKTQDKSNIVDFLTVIIKAKLMEDDVLEVYFSENVKDTYNDSHKISHYVKGDTTFQELVFKLPERIYPLKLRIDLGSKMRETPILLEEIILSTGGNSRVYKFEEIKTNFRINQYLEINNESNGYLRKSINGNYDPFIMSGDLTKVTVDLFSEN